MPMILELLALVTAGRAFDCAAIALHDVDGPIHCRAGEKIRLQGIGATETDGSCRPGQPCIPGDPMVQRRDMARRVIGATIAREDPGRFGQAWFVRPVMLQCVATGRSHERVTAWCRRPDGADLSCEAIRAGIAARWTRYDPSGRLAGCSPPWPRGSLARLFSGPGSWAR